MPKGFIAAKRLRAMLDDDRYNTYVCVNTSTTVDVRRNDIVALSGARPNAEFKVAPVIDDSSTLTSNAILGIASYDCLAYDPTPGKVFNKVDVVERLRLLVDTTGRSQWDPVYLSGSTAGAYSYTPGPNAIQIGVVLEVGDATKGVLLLCPDYFNRSTGGGTSPSTPLAVKEDATTVVASTTTLVFADSDFNVTATGAGEATVAVVPAATPTPLTVKEDATTVEADTTTLVFDGAGFNLSSTGTGEVTVTAVGGGGSTDLSGYRPERDTTWELANAADPTVYVNADTGSDSTGDGSSGNPYASISRAIIDVPINRERAATARVTIEVEGNVALAQQYTQFDNITIKFVTDFATPELSLTPSAHIREADSNVNQVTITAGGSGDNAYRGRFLQVQGGSDLQNGWVLASRDNGDGTHDLKVVCNVSVAVDPTNPFAPNLTSSGVVDFFPLSAFTGCTGDVVFQDSDGLILENFYKKTGTTTFSRCEAQVKTSTILGRALVVEDSSHVLVTSSRIANNDNLTSFGRMVQCLDSRLEMVYVGVDGSDAAPASVESPALPGNAISIYASNSELVLDFLDMLDTQPVYFDQSKFAGIITETSYIGFAGLKAILNGDASVKGYFVVDDQAGAGASFLRANWDYGQLPAIFHTLATATPDYLVHCQGGSITVNVAGGGTLNFSDGVGDLADLAEGVATVASALQVNPSEFPDGPRVCSTTGNPFNPAEFYVTVPSNAALSAQSNVIVLDWVVGRRITWLTAPLSGADLNVDFKMRSPRYDVPCYLMISGSSGGPAITLDWSTAADPGLGVVWDGTALTSIAANKNYVVEFKYIDNLLGFGSGVWVARTIAGPLP